MNYQSVGLRRTEAFSLAKELNADLLLIDEKIGKNIAVKEILNVRCYWTPDDLIKNLKISA